MNMEREREGNTFPGLLLGCWIYLFIYIMLCYNMFHFLTESKIHELILKIHATITNSMESLIILSLHSNAQNSCRLW